MGEFDPECKEIVEQQVSLPTHLPIGKTDINSPSIDFLGRLADLKTLSLHVGYFPKPWTSALVTVIPKPNKDQLASRAPEANYWRERWPTGSKNILILSEF